jgi:hypothetical protein
MAKSENVRLAALADGDQRKKKEKIVIVDNRGAVSREARDTADANLTAAKKEAGFFSKIWKHNLFREYYRQKEIFKAKQKKTEPLTSSVHTSQNNLEPENPLRLKPCLPVFIP